MPDGDREVNFILSVLSHPTLAPDISSLAGYYKSSVIQSDLLSRAKMALLLRLIPSRLTWAWVSPHTPVPIRGQRGVISLLNPAGLGPHASPTNNH